MTAPGAWSESSFSFFSPFFFWFRFLWREQYGGMSESLATYDLDTLILAQAQTFCSC